MQSIKETAANVAASAKSGMEKTKAAVQEKVFVNTIDSIRRFVHSYVLKSDNVIWCNYVDGENES